MTALAEKDRVALSWDREMRGTLYRYGEYQSIIRLDDGRERIVLTNDLEKIDAIDARRKDV